MDNEKRVASFKLQLLFDLVTQRVFFPWGTNSVFNVELQKEMKKKVMSKNVKGIHRELMNKKSGKFFFRIKPLQFPGTTRMSCFQQKLPLKSHFTSDKWNALTFPFLSGVKTRNETIDWEGEKFCCFV